MLILHMIDSNYNQRHNGIKFDYPEKLIEEVKRVAEEKGDSTHAYFEVVKQRTEQELSKIEEGSHGGKTLIDYIYIYGKITDNVRKEAIKTAKAAGTKYIFEHDYVAYRELEKENIKNTKIERREENMEEQKTYEEKTYNAAKQKENDEDER